MHLKKENTALASMGPVVIDEAWYLWCVPCAPSRAQGTFLFPQGTPKALRKCGVVNTQGEDVDVGGG